MLQNELKKLETGTAESGLDFSRYEMQQPVSSQMKDINAWNKTLDQAAAQVTHQSIRKMNLEISERNASEEWKKYCNVLDSIKRKYSNKLSEVKKEIQNTNWKRKTLQEEAGKEICILENQWAQQTMSNFDIQIEIANLRNKIAVLDK